MSSKNEEKYISTDALEETPKISMWMVQNLMEHIIGKILTQLDASISDKEQRQALKSVIKSDLWEATDKVRNWYIDQSDTCGSSFPYSGRVEE